MNVSHSKGTVATNRIEFEEEFMITKDLIQLGIVILAMIVVVKVAGYIEDRFEEESSSRIDLTVLISIFLVAALGIYGLVKLYHLFSYFLLYLKH